MCGSENLSSIYLNEEHRDTPDLAGTAFKKLTLAIKNTANRQLSTPNHNTIPNLTLLVGAPVLAIRLSSYGRTWVF